ncbi:hypothetical protein BD779DRAFT_1479192 [Infundibulicybe gibba]|nr:hypothetical protein BD779DRAFT_1479192 [Infundibulicybe gibba]
MSRSDISESTELDIIEEMILLPTSGRSTFSLGLNGFDPYSHWVITIGKPEIQLQGRVRGQYQAVHPPALRWLQPARASAMSQHTSPVLVQTPNGEWPGDISNNQSPTASARSNGNASCVAVFQQVSDGSPFNFQPVESNSGGFSASASTQGLSLVQDNLCETRTTLVSHNDQHETFGVDITKRGRKFTGRRPKTGGLQGMQWFSSSYHRSIIPKLGAQDNPLVAGDIYSHTNTLTRSTKVWMYTGEMLGLGGWCEITDKYFKDDGEIIHPMDSERVLSIQDENLYRTLDSSQSQV